MSSPTPGNVTDRQMGAQKTGTGLFLDSTGLSFISDSDSPVSAFGQVPLLLLCHWLRNMEGRGVLIA